MAVRTPRFFRYRPSAGRLLLAAVIVWIALLTLVILLDPHGSGPLP
ncbi:hypothetical protein LDL08_05525 [Nonomuraea glycinis]|nr:hypothetical protein [Nonomuraea glycinis]MCA2175640.1 hypothetical protein [Nonomuraea glycinis]